MKDKNQINVLRELGMYCMSASCQVREAADRAMRIYADYVQGRVRLTQAARDLVSRLASMGDGKEFELPKADVEAMGKELVEMSNR